MTMSRSPSRAVPLPGVSPTGAVASAPTSGGESTVALRMLLVLSALMGFGNVATDMYLPALPAMARALHAAPGQMEFTISGYLVGFGLGQLLWGPVGDRYGRKGPGAIGLSLFVRATIGWALSASV